MITITPFGPNGKLCHRFRTGLIRTGNNSRAYYVSGPSNNGKLLANQVAKIGKLYYGFTNTDSAGLLKDAAVLEPRFTM